MQQEGRASQDVAKSGVAPRWKRNRNGLASCPCLVLALPAGAGTAPQGSAGSSAPSRVAASPLSPRPPRPALLGGRRRPRGEAGHGGGEGFLYIECKHSNGVSTETTFLVGLVDPEQYSWSWVSLNWVRDEQSNRRSLFKNSFLGATEMPTLGHTGYKNRLAVC